MLERLGSVLGCLGFMPSEMGRRADRWSWGVAVGVHVMGVVLAVVAIFLLRVAFWTQRSSADYGEIFFKLMQWVWDAMHNGDFWQTTIAIAVAVESGTILLATTLCAWGARDESIGRSSWAAIKRVWLLAPHGALVIAMVGAGWVFLNEDYEMTVLFIGVMWCMVTVLRCLGAARSDRPVERRPMCEFCGYDLTGFTSDESVATGHCPECDRAIAESLGDDARAGTAWQVKRSLRSWWTCAWESAFHSEKFGRTIRLYESQQDHRGFFLMHLLWVAVINFLGLQFIVFATNERLTRWLWLDVLEFWQLSVMLSLIGMVVLTVGTAGMAALSVGKPIKRNLLPVAMRATSYMTVWALGMLVAIWLLIVITVWGQRAGWVRVIADALDIDRALVVMVPWIAGAVLLLGGYNLAIKRMVMAARFANR